MEGDYPVSTKERHQLEFDWHKLVDLCIELGRPATAGEFAEYLGIARSTAARRLAAMDERGGVTKLRAIARNRFPKYIYQPVGLGDAWNYVYGETVFPPEDK